MIASVLDHATLDHLFTLCADLVQGFSDSWEVSVDRSAAHHHGNRGSFENLFSRTGQHHTCVAAPYSPELNPIENLWHYLKSHYWSNRAYADYEALEQAAIDAWRKAALDQGLIKTVCAAPYAKSDSSN